MRKSGRELDEAFRKLRKLAGIVRRYRAKNSGEVRRGYPDEVERLAVELSESGRYSVGQISEATGLSETAIQGWRRMVRPRRRGRPAKRRGGFARVRVVKGHETGGQAAVASSTGYLVEGPGGLVIGRMTIEEIAVLWRQLIKGNAAA